MIEAPELTLQNHILAALSTETYERIAPHIEVVPFPHAKILYEMGDPIEYVYFPFNAMISLVTEMADGKVVEVGLVGSDGLSGVLGFMGEETSPDRALVQIADGGARCKLAVLKEEFNRGGDLQTVILRYARMLMKQISRTAACNASHVAEERLSRWLLMCHDRVHSLDLALTQEFLAEMLGTRRATVSLAAMVLQTEGLITYNRGHIRITDLQGLEDFTCECYMALRRSDRAINRSAALPPDSLEMD